MYICYALPGTVAKSHFHLRVLIELCHINSWSICCALLMLGALWKFPCMLLIALLRYGKVRNLCSLKLRPQTSLALTKGRTN